MTTKTKKTKLKEKKKAGAKKPPKRKHDTRFKKKSLDEKEWEREQAELRAKVDAIVDKYDTGEKKRITLSHRRSLTIGANIYSLERLEREIRRTVNVEEYKILREFEKHLEVRMGIDKRWDRPDDMDLSEWNAERIEGLFKVKRFYWNRHMELKPDRYWRTPEEILSDFLKDMFNLFHVDEGMEDEDFALVKEFMASDRTQPMPRWIRVSRRGSKECFNCCEEMEVETDGLFLRWRGQCKHPTGFPAYTFECNFPTGKVVVDDDLRPWFRPAYYRIQRNVEKKDFDVNGVRGQMNRSLEYAKDDYMCGQIGNTCPGLWQNDQDLTKLMIANPAYQNKEGEYLESLDIEPTIEGYTRIAGICTDLWNYALADLSLIEGQPPIYRTFDRELGEMVFEIAEDEIGEIPGRVVEIPPGRYRSTHRYHLLTGDRTEPEIFAYIERVGDCT